MGKMEVRTLADATHALASAPADLAAWLALSAALDGAGEAERAADSFRRLGEAASELGQVALAVACARWLDGAGRADAASELVDRIGETHGAGSDRIDWSARPAPPPRAGTTPGQVPVSSDRDAVLEAADAAVRAAAEAAAGRASDKLAPTPMIRVLAPDEVRALIGMIEIRRRPAGHVVVDVGQPARALFWIARGSVEVTRGEHHLGDLTAGSFFGEIALVGGTTRTARVSCREETWLLEIPAASVEEVASRAPKLAKVLAEYARSRLLANVTKTSELFRRLDDDERRTLLARFSSRLLPANTRLLERGKTNDTLYVIVSGSVEVRDEAGVTVAELAPGDGVGEISLISGKPASADVVCAEQVAVLALPRAAFDEVAVNHPGLLAEVYKLKVEREQENADTIIHDADDLIV